MGFLPLASPRLSLGRHRPLADLLDRDDWGAAIAARAAELAAERAELLR
eukprot:gene31376-11820_t